MYSMQANKIVNGAEEDTGTFDSVVYDATKQTLRFTMKDNQRRNAVWLLRIDGMQNARTLTQMEIFCSG